MGLVWAGQVMAQPATPPTGGDQQAGGGTRGQRPSAADMQARMEEWRKRISDQQRQQLGASEDEWKVLQPRIEKVQNLQRQARGSMFGRGGFGFGGTGGPGGNSPFGGRSSRFGRRDANSPTDGNSAASTPRTPTNPDGTPRELTDIEKKTTALRDVLNNKDASPAQIAEALTSLRAAKAKQTQELATARKELQEIVTPQQEANLVLMGVLE